MLLSMVDATSRSEKQKYKGEQKEKEEDRRRERRHETYTIFYIRQNKIPFLNLPAIDRRNKTNLTRLDDYIVNSD